MKYWILTTEFPPFHGGGISTYCLHTGLMFTEKGHDVTVFVPSHELGCEALEVVYSNIRVIRFKPAAKPHFDCLGYSAALSYQFAEIILDSIGKYGPPDFIETQEYMGIGYYLMLRKKLGEAVLQNIPIVLTAHAPSFFYLWHNQAPVFSLPDFWTGEMEKWTLKAADIFISPSHYLINNLAGELGEYKEKFQVIRNPCKNFTKTKTESSFTVGDIVFFGKLTYQKGCLSLIKFLSELWDSGFNHTVKFIGDDHYFGARQSGMKDYLIKKFKRHFDAGRFVFEGKLTPDQLNDRISVAHLIIVPSIVDNFPYTVVESMLLGKVLLVSDGGGQSEMIEDAVTGFIYRHNDVRSFAAKLDQALQLSPEECAAMGERAQKRISQMCNYEHIYNEKMQILHKSGSCQSRVFPFIYELEKKAPLQDISYKTGKLSIVVPYYNTDKYLAETIQSIAEVNFPDKEIIVVNDGSDDATSIAVLYQLQEKYQFRIITQPNMGLSAARNTGLTSATGEYIAFLDADDKIDPEFYRRSVDILNRYQNLSFVSCWVLYFDGAEDIWPAHNPEPPFMLLHNMINAGFLCRRVDYLNFGRNDPGFEYGMEDYDANLSLLENGCRGVVIPEPLYYYRVHSASMARGFNKYNQLFLYRNLSFKHRELYRKFAPEVFNLLLANGPSYLYDNPSLTPDTDILTMRNWIKELEKSNQWYQNTLDYQKNNIQTAARSYASGGNGNVSTCHSMIGVGSSGNTIKEWYHKEYEVLPLWYKRVGHIIKVFQGHRTVRSLFSKNNEK